MEIIKSQNNFYYAVDEESGRILLLPPAVLTKLNEEGVHKENEYYKKKIDFLKKHGMFSTTPTGESLSFLTVEDIEQSVVNTPQIIFEVTDMCNLKCRYCGYGNFYDNYDPRCHKKMDFRTFLVVMKSMEKIWGESQSIKNKNLRISFYGGEPLLNFDFIYKTVNHLSSYPSEKTFTYSLTTNGILLNKYIDFFIEHRFDLLISIDGDKMGNSYRVFANGKSSFDILCKNIDLIKTKSPDYFEKHVRFNSVLHDRNSVYKSSAFLYNKFGKLPITNELNLSGVNPRFEKKFNKMFRSKIDDYKEIKDSSLKDLLEDASPNSIEYIRYLSQFKIKQFNKSLNNFISSNVESSSKDKTEKFFPTGTCVPFSRKIFISVEGKIYPCERIGNEIDFGRVDDSGLNINYNNIVVQYNKLLHKYLIHCATCCKRSLCPVCIVSDLDGYKFCYKRYGKGYKEKFLKSLISFYEQHPEEYSKALMRIFLK